MKGQKKKKKPTTNREKDEFCSPLLSIYKGISYNYLIE